MSQLLPTTPYRGTRDFPPALTSSRQQVFQRIYHAVESYGYARYDGPLLESAEIYEAKSGQEIADQQLYSLVDRGGRRLALRPEMTPSVARMIAAEAGRLVFPVRWYSHVNCFRYERPQRGRLREHWQVNVDVFGSDSANCEIEIFQLIHSVMAALGATPDMWELRASDRVILHGVLTELVGVPEQDLRPVSTMIDRWLKSSREDLVQQAAEVGLNETRFVLLEELLASGPEILDKLSPEVRAKSSLAQVLSGPYADLVRFDLFTVRGLAYYTGTVFEVFDRDPANARSLFGGGRYADLAGLFTRQRIPGIGFGMGDVTLQDFCETHGLWPQPTSEADVVVIVLNADLLDQGRELAQRLRARGVRVSTPLEHRALPKEFARAERAGASHAVILAPQEWAAGQVIFRDLHAKIQTEVPVDQVVERAAAAIGVSA